MKFKAMLWCAIIISCIASIRLLSYQQSFLLHHLRPSNLDNEISEVFFSISDDSKYWHQRCPHKVFIGDAYDGWMICEPDDMKQLSGGLVYSLGIDPTVDDGKGDVEWEKNMAKTYHTVHHIWDSHIDIRKYTTDGLHLSLIHI